LFTYPKQGVTFWPILFRNLISFQKASQSEQFEKLSKSFDWLKSHLFFGHVNKLNIIQITLMESRTSFQAQFFIADIDIALQLNPYQCIRM